MKEKGAHPIYGYFCEELSVFFRSASGGSFQLAVLHPDKLALYFYGQGNSSDTRDLFHLRSYKLRASAYSMVSGSFGGITGTITLPHYCDHNGF